jgi:outer membrane immunogenic protein
MPGNLRADMRRALGGKAVARAVPKAAKFSNRAGSKSFDILSAGYRRGAQRDVWSSIGNIGPGTVMKKILRANAALAAMVAGPAVAADMPVKALPAAPLTFYDWSGAYVGFNAGDTWYDSNRHFPTPGAGGFGVAGVNPDFSTSGGDGIYGFHAGAQWQWGVWVLGAEAALSECFGECRSISGLRPVALGAPPDSFGEHKITNLFTAGPRLGYAWDRWMIFATGGWASADLKGTHCSTISNLCGPPITTLNGASRNSGWYAGGGLDVVVHTGALVDVILGAEYQHYDVSRRSAFCLSPGCNLSTGADFDLGAKGDIVRARLTIKTQGYRVLWGSSAATY